MFSPWKTVVLVWLGLILALPGLEAPDIIAEGKKPLPSEVRVDLNGHAADLLWVYQDRGRRFRLLDEQAEIVGRNEFRLMCYPRDMKERLVLDENGVLIERSSILGQPTTALSPWLPCRFVADETDPVAKQRVTFRVNAIEGKDIIVKESAREQFDAEGKLLTTEEREEIQVARQSRLLWIALAGFLGLVILGFRRHRRAQAGVS